MIPFSVLDLAPIVEGGDASQALENSRDLARRAESLGYLRYWLAEHHNMPGIASAATSVVIGHIAAATKALRVGAGGIMLPNHSPLVIAEQFGTLAALFPGRIDLGVGRAPGTDPETARALRRYLPVNVDGFPDAVRELMHYFRAPEAGQRVRAVPGAGLNMPIWILGSSLFGASLAAELGLPFAFASHFAPALLLPAFEIYRKNFRPSSEWREPYAMAAVNVIAAETDDEARLMLTSVEQAFASLRRGHPVPLPPPVRGFRERLSPLEQAALAEVLACAVVGSHETVRRGLAAFIDRTRANELMIATMVFDHGARTRSYEITAAVRAELTQQRDLP